MGARVRSLKRRQANWLQALPASGGSLPYHGFQICMAQRPIL